MALFQVEGWDLKTKDVSYDSANAKKEHKKKERKARAKKDEQRRLKETEDEYSNYDLENEQEEGSKDALAPVEKKQIDGSKKETKKDTKKADKPVSKKRSLDEVDSKPKDRDAQVESAAKKPLTALQQKMLAKLSGSRFRWINEQLYTTSSASALDLIKKQPQLFDEYHEGFRSQVQSWPENPVDVFVDQFRIRSQKPVNAPGGLPGLPSDKTIVVADMGCGEAQLAQDLNTFYAQYNRKQKKHFKKKCVVHSFDLKKANKLITVADIKNVPLANESCTVVVFCLALMGTNFLDFIKEAYRLLAPRGELWIAEIKSRFADRQGDEFVNAIKLMGFFHKKTDDSNKMFTRFEFFKPPQDIIEERKAKLERKQKFIEVETEKEELETKRTKAPEGKWLLKPCIYKRR
ncbi:LAME_0G09846g1_1 [Lachancea meyersii CBS 8951]|uniref:Ribosomal RNA-processing protein 8 n=1 Tax=Lachancea meyersii CBS 8951 TaxID=1266667 RepID=A0A1G4K8S2_9SACH|nr:LAME_0G09846g1_1 [Lachancea meyersii CBS 8951]